MNRVNLLGNYPNPKNKRYVSENLRTINHRIVASYRGKEFYDGKRIFGYGGFKYDGRWKSVAQKICRKYKLNNNSKILQLSSKKGFLLHDLKILFPKMKICGLETSSYALSKTMKSVKKYVKKVETYTEFLQSVEDIYIDIIHIRYMDLHLKILVFKEIRFLCLT